MLGGIQVQAPALLAGGLVLFALTAFQVLVGKRVIRFKGKLHMRVHRWGGYSMVVLAALHGLAGAAYLGYLG